MATWTANSDLHSSNLKITLEQYEQQENYGLNSLRPGKIKLDVDEDVYDNQIDLSSLRPDVKAELELESYRRKLGFPVKKTNRKWTDEREDDDVEGEIKQIIRKVGIDREPVNYRLNSKTTAKTALSLDKLPVAGVKDLFLTHDHFKFENPFVKSKPEPTAKVNDRSVYTTSSEYSSSSGSGTSSRSFEGQKFGVPGEKYVSPAQLYLMKARHNR